MINQIFKSSSILAVCLTANLALAKENKLCDIDIPNEGYLKSFQGLQKGKDAWLFRNHDLIDSFGPDRSGYNGLRAVQQLLAARGTTLMIVPLPTRGIVHPEFVLDESFNHRLAAKNYLNYLNRLRRVGLVVPALDKMTAGGQELPLYFARDHHWTPAGAATAARLVKEEISKTELLAEVPAMNFTTVSVDIDSTNGSYNRAALEACAFEYQSESFEVFFTESQIDLFADVAEPKVVLVGTSNSNGSKHFNFDGFLRQELGVDVLNAATSGGGFDESLVTYLSSEVFKAQPPKLIIWEVPGYYSLNQSSFYDSILKQLGDES